MRDGRSGGFSDTLDHPLTLGAPARARARRRATGALARPDRRVIVWDGDGGLLMNLGSLVTIAGQAPKNLYHIVLDNGMYATTGGQPVPNAGGFSFAGLAREAGYPKTYEFDDLEEWTTRIGAILNEEGPILIVVKSVPLIPDWSNLKHREIKSSAHIARAALSA